MALDLGFHADRRDTVGVLAGLAAAARQTVHVGTVTVFRVSLSPLSGACVLATPCPSVPRPT